MAKGDSCVFLPAAILGATAAPLISLSVYSAAAGAQVFGDLAFGDQELSAEYPLTYDSELGCLNIGKAGCEVLDEFVTARGKTVETHGQNNAVPRAKVNRTKFDIDKLLERAEHALNHSTAATTTAPATPGLRAPGYGSHQNLPPHLPSPPRRPSRVPLPQPSPVLPLDLSTPSTALAQDPPPPLSLLRHALPTASPLRLDAAADSGGRAGAVNMSVQPPLAENTRAENTRAFSTTWVGNPPHVAAIADSLRRIHEATTSVGPQTDTQSCRSSSWGGYSNRSNGPRGQLPSVAWSAAPELSTARSPEPSTAAGTPKAPVSSSVVGHVSAARHQCPCGQTFSSKSNLNSHRKQICELTQNKQKFFCNYCPKSYKSSGTRQQHEVGHQDGSRVTCERCSAVLASPTSLRRHQTKCTRQ